MADDKTRDPDDKVLCCGGFTHEGKPVLCSDRCKPVPRRIEDPRWTEEQRPETD